MRSDRLVSVILPTYNRATLLARSIGSVLAQTDGDLELIVVDDGSEDDSASVVAGFADPRVRYVKLRQNRGLPAARNAGIVEARGAYVAYQDSDDEWHAEKLARQRRALDAHPDAAVVYCDMHRIRADGRVFYHRSPSIVRGRIVDPDTRYWQSYMLAMQPVLMRRACLEDLRFDERLIRFEDLDLHLRLAQRHEFVHMAEPLVSYHETQGLTTDMKAEFTGRRQLLRKYVRVLLATERAFAIREAIACMLGRSLMPIVARHLTPL